jgi:hypothetical protein
MARAPREAHARKAHKCFSEKLFPVPVFRNDYARLDHTTVMSPQVAAYWRKQETEREPFHMENANCLWLGKSDLHLSL